MKTWNDSPQLIWVKLNKKKQWTEKHAMNEWTFCVTVTNKEWQGSVTRPWFHPHPHKCCGGLGSRQNWIPTKVRGCERLEAPRTPLKCSMQWNRWQCSPEDRSGRHCYRKNTGLPVCLGRVCTALGVFWWDCWRLASWLSAEAEKGDSLQENKGVPLKCSHFIDNQ